VGDNIKRRRDRVIGREKKEGRESEREGESKRKI